MAGKSVEEYIEYMKEQELLDSKAKEEHERNAQRHLNHPFYKRVDEVTDEVKVEQILKGAGKYPEPFNPASWTGPQLVNHGLQEARDLQVYLVGLLDHVERQDAAYNSLLNDHSDLKEKYGYVITENTNFRKELEKYKDRCKDYEDKLNALQNQKVAAINELQTAIRKLKAYENVKGAVIDERI